MDFEVLGLLGPAGSGKDLVADWLCKEKGFVKVAFADPIKRFASRAFGIDWDRLWGPSDKRNEEFEVNEEWWLTAVGHLHEASKEFLHREVLEIGYKTKGILALYDWFNDLRHKYREKISARVILQTLGTEWGRSVDELMWAKYAHKVAEEIKGGCGYGQAGGLVDTELFTKSSGVVIPDHRFINELKLTQNKGGYVIRLRRLEHEKKNEEVGVPGHRSEAEMKAIPDSDFDHVFNFGEGVDKVYEALEGAFEHKLWINTRGRS